ncbi:permease prefix domain 1-containing protein [Pseudoflavonifractor sp. MSJ-37]|uniref:permease prefix domain 1-containing protein n=1 Tax=Pseudoflavonifractor sp. MSJ-37 TaxID=2841531 RepID=UPI001C10A35B|nr:permease prefix domain 1-containing protein [Pseudoflavonifractor sp. MSJ-37]MBU5436002.1 hypothetical protein [Pseudoflavonifractor sp. MSJ-37]
MDSFRRFCQQVCAQIRWAPARSQISDELLAHLEDHADALCARDSALSPEEARRRAVAAMGDPAAIGRAMDALHPPLWGILSRTAGGALALLTLTALVFSVSLFWSPLATQLQRYHHLQSSSSSLPRLWHWQRIEHTLFQIRLHNLQASIASPDGTYSDLCVYDVQAVELDPWTPYDHSLDLRGFSLSTADGTPLTADPDFPGHLRLPAPGGPQTVLVSYRWGEVAFSFLLQLDPEVEYD